MGSWSKAQKNSIIQSTQKKTQAKMAIFEETNGGSSPGDRPFEKLNPLKIK